MIGQKGFTPIILLVCILLIVVVSAIGIYIFQQRNTNLATQALIVNPSHSPQPSVIPKQSVLQINNDASITGNWNNYSNKYFEIKYPSNVNASSYNEQQFEKYMGTTQTSNEFWKQSYGYDGPTVLSAALLEPKNIHIMQDQGDPISSQGYRIWIWVYKTDGLSLDQWVDKYKIYPSNYIANTPDYPNLDKNQHLINIAQINGIPGRVIYRRDDSYSDDFVLINKDEIAIIWTDIYNLKYETEKPTMYQILSTFKFAN